MPLSLPLAGGRTAPPRVPPSVVRRPLLEERLATALRGRLTTVIADAGFGKSTLLAAWAGANPCPWYAARMEEIGVEAAAFPRRVPPGAALSRP